MTCSRRAVAVRHLSTSRPHHEVCREITAGRGGNCNHRRMIVVLRRFCARIGFVITSYTPRSSKLIVIMMLIRQDRALRATWSKWRWLAVLTDVSITLSASLLPWFVCVCVCVWAQTATRKTTSSSKIIRNDICTRVLSWVLGRKMAPSTEVEINIQITIECIQTSELVNCLMPMWHLKFFFALLDYRCEAIQFNTFCRQNIKLKCFKA